MLLALDQIQQSHLYKKFSSLPCVVLDDWLPTLGYWHELEHWILTACIAHISCITCSHDLPDVHTQARGPQVQGHRCTYQGII